MYEVEKKIFNGKVSVVAIHFLFKVNNYSIFHLVSVWIFRKFYLKKIMTENDDSIRTAPPSVTLESSSYSAQQQRPDDSGRSNLCFFCVYGRN